MMPCRLLRPCFLPWLAALAMFGPACAAAAAATPPPAASSAAPGQASGAPIPVYGYQVVHAFPHDRDAFTEGLFFLNGTLYESTGLNGHSSVRRVELETGQVLQRSELPAELFGEGITAWGNRLIGLTWQTHVGFVLDLQSFEFGQQFSYPGEGWGLTHNERELVMSDGTAELRFLDPLTLKESHRVRVSANGKPVTQINELEWVEGEVFANLWQTDRIARIDPKTGHVTGWIDLAGLLPMKDFVPGRTDVLNGIAYDSAAKRLFVTGKLWPKLFEITLVKKGAKAG